MKLSPEQKMNLSDSAAITQPYHTLHRPITAELTDEFETLVGSDNVAWTVSYHLLRRLGSGGQSVVFLADRYGAHDASFRIAMKFFTPACYATVESYHLEMARLARVAMRIAKIQQDHLVDVLNVVKCGEISAMIMEWVDGFDLDELLRPSTLAGLKEHVPEERWNYINDVIITSTHARSRLKPGIAIAILRECFAGLASLHREGIVHADLKPSNIMLKKTGNAKVIDFGSAFFQDDLPHRQTWTPRYAAVELLEGESHSMASDLASLGYVLVEMLSGVTPFEGILDIQKLIDAKKKFPSKLHEFLPKDVASNEMLVHLIRGLIAPSPDQRFPSAEAADLLDRGAAEFHRQLIKGNLASEYEHDLRFWLAELVNAKVLGNQD
jgi:serine/threonine-protein kinase